MNNINKSKYANLLFFCVVMVYVATNLFVSLLEVSGIELNILANLLVSQMIIIVPGLIIFLLVNRGTEKLIPYNKLKPVTIPLLIVFTWLIGPLVSAVNVFSQLFTKNEVLEVSNEVLALPVWLMILIIGIVGPFCEEFVFRGIIYNCLSKSSGRYIASGVISALFFGLMHMNFNQFCYAFVLGIVFALINEILDSAWPSFICHAVVNTQNIVLLIAMDKLLATAGDAGIADLYDDAARNALTSGMQTKIMIGIMFISLMFVALFTTTLAILLFYGICKIEGKEERFKQVFTQDLKAEFVEKREKILFPTGIIAMSICIFVIFLLEPIVKLLKK